MRYYISPQVRLLLVNQSQEKVQVLYASNLHAWQMPMIGPRPPYYCHPKYQAYYPVL